MFYNIITKIKYRTIQKSMQVYIKHVNNSACPPITIGKWVYAFKLLYSVALL